MSGDLTAAGAGESAAAELLVPIGHHGHGWAPGPGVRKESRNADLLVHGMPGFQPWVDESRSDLDGDGASVRTVDVSSTVEALFAGTTHADGEHDDHPDGDDLN